MPLSLTWRTFAAVGPRPLLGPATRARTPATSAARCAGAASGASPSSGGYIGGGGAGGDNNSSSGGGSGSNDDDEGTVVPPARRGSTAAAAATWAFFFRALAVHAVHLAARLLYQPWQPAAERAQRELAKRQAVRDACAALRVDDLPALQDLLNSISLAECVYRGVDDDGGGRLAVEMMNSLKAALPQLVTVQTMQAALPHVHHRFLVAEGPGALYVACMGTKVRRDLLTNAMVWQEEVFRDAAMLSASEAERLPMVGVGGEGDKARTAAVSGSGGRGPAAHRGFLQRARSIPVESLYNEARARDKRLVLCGHSLGGAVATLCTLRLLQQLPAPLHNTVTCYAFATPAIGNRALAAMVRARGWEERIKNYVTPEDPIPGLLSNGRVPSPVTAAAAPAPQPSATAPQAAAPTIATANNILLSAPAGGFSLGRFTGRGAAPAAVAAAAAHPAAQEAEAVEAAGEAGVALQRTSPDAQRAEEARLMRLARAAFQTAAAVTALPRHTAAAVRSRAPEYLPIGQQLHLTATAVMSVSQSSTQQQAACTTSLAVTATPAAAAPVQRRSWLPGWGWGSVADGESSGIIAGGGSMDDDNVDVALAASAAGGGAALPERAPRRTLFPMHRMITYRSRIFSICKGALAGRLWLPALPHLPHLPHPDDVMATSLLAPAVYPLSAQATAVLSLTVPTLAPAGPVDSTSGRGSTGQADAGSSSAVRGGTGGPWQSLSWGRGGSRAETQGPVEVLIRVEGKGLGHVTAAYIEGPHPLTRKGKKKAAATIVHRPSTTQVLVVEQKATSALIQPFTAFASWLALQLGWVQLLARLQPAGEKDFLIARATLPAELVCAARWAAHDPIKLALHETGAHIVLQSDFAVQSVPLDIRVGSIDAVQAEQAQQVEASRARTGIWLPLPSSMGLPTGV